LLFWEGRKARTANCRREAYQICWGNPSPIRSHSTTNKSCHHALPRTPAG